MLNIMNSLVRNEQDPYQGPGHKKENLSKEEPVLLVKAVAFGMTLYTN